MPYKADQQDADDHDGQADGRHRTAVTVGTVGTLERAADMAHRQVKQLVGRVDRLVVATWKGNGSNFG